MKSEVFSLPPDCPPGDRRREHEDRCEVVCDFDSDRDEQDCGVHCSVASCQSVIQARGKGKEVFSLSDEGPDADAEQGQSESAESEAEEQGVHVVLPPLERLQPPLSDCYSGRREREGTSFTLHLAASRSLRSPAPG